MKLELKPLASDIFIVIYVVATLFFRLKFEHNNNAVSPALSVVYGLCFIAFLWSMIKLKFLNPNYFGLFKARQEKS